MSPARRPSQRCVRSGQDLSCESIVSVRTSPAKPAIRIGLDGRQVRLLEATERHRRWLARTWAIEENGWIAPSPDCPSRRPVRVDPGVWPSAAREARAPGRRRWPRRDTARPGSFCARRSNPAPGLGPTSGCERRTASFAALILRWNSGYVPAHRGRSRTSALGTSESFHRLGDTSGHGNGRSSLLTPTFGGDPFRRAAAVRAPTPLGHAPPADLGRGRARVRQGEGRVACRGRKRAARSRESSSRGCDRREPCGPTDRWVGRRVGAGCASTPSA